MFAIGCRPLWSYKRSPLMKGCYRTQATDLSGCKQFIEFGDPEGLLATSLDTVQRIINAAMARSRRTIESKDPSSPPTFIPPPPPLTGVFIFSPRYTERRSDEFLHLLIVARASSLVSCVLANREDVRPRGYQRVNRIKTHTYTHIYIITYIYIYIYT